VASLDLIAVISKKLADYRLGTYLKYVVRVPLSVYQAPPVVNIGVRAQRGTVEYVGPAFHIFRGFFSVV
jgi:hypothetical protein